MNRTLIVFSLLCIFGLIYLLVDKLNTEVQYSKYETQINQLENNNMALRADSIENEKLQAEYAQKLDSLSNIKSKIKYRYGKKIDTIYYMPDSVVYGILSIHLDSLYKHRFAGFVTK